MAVSSFLERNDVARTAANSHTLVEFATRLLDASTAHRSQVDRSNRTKHIPFGFASPVTTSHAAKGSVFVDLRNCSNLKIDPLTAWHCLEVISREYWPSVLCLERFKPEVPRETLRGGIPGAVLEPLVRSWSHFVGIYRQNLTRALGI